jgi:carbamoyl-phosphate synthase large subunit
VVATLEDWTRRLATALEVVGLLNVQFAVKDGDVYVIEANPRASRTVPFVAKATGVPLAAIAARVMAGASLETLRSEGLAPQGPVRNDYVSVKEAVLPFNRFPRFDTLLGPEMRSTGEVMGVDRTFGLAFVKAQMAAGPRLPLSGRVFFSLADRDKPAGAEVAKAFSDLGFLISATVGTAGYLRDQGIEVDQLVAKIGDAGLAPDAVEFLASGQVQLVINTPSGRGSRADGAHIRSACIGHGVPCLTTLSASRAAAEGIGDWLSHPLEVLSLQELHARTHLRP